MSASRAGSKIALASAPFFAAYRELKGLDRGIDKDGNVVVDPDFKIGAGRIPRPPG